MGVRILCYSYLLIDNELSTVDCSLCYPVLLQRKLNGESSKLLLSNASVVLDVLIDERIGEKCFLAFY